MTPERERLRLLDAVAEAAEAWRDLSPLAGSMETLAVNAQLDGAVDALRAHDAAPQVVGETRKIVQISTAFDSGDGFGENGSSYQPAMVTTALCSDGTLWWKHHHESPWVQHQPIPATVEEVKR